MKKNTITGTIWQAAVALFLILPLVVTATYSFSERWITILPENLTLKFYQARLSDGRFWAGILRGMAAAAIPVIATNIIMLLALFAAIIYFPKTEKYLQVCCIIPTTINGIILATSILSSYAGTGTIFSNRIVMLMCAYCIFCLPLTYQGIRNSLYAVNTKMLLEAAAILGADEFYGFVRIIVPAILPGLVNTALINFAGLFGDFAIIKIIAASQFETVQTYLYKSRNTDTQSFSAGVVILLLITMIINIAVHRNAAGNVQRGKEENA
ncbi:MAG: ABC transporter permease subunit [Lachnospiraceae bacterium]|nr:ABC transporter permease subunit [Lachnospiraceae bacterium]